MTCGLPLTARADACRTARHGLALIATARPPAFIITMAKEVARYNALAQNAQAHHHHQLYQLNNSVLVRGRPEILHVVDLLVEKIPNDVADLLVEVRYSASDVMFELLKSGICEYKLSFCVSDYYYYYLICF